MRPDVRIRHAWHIEHKTRLMEGAWSPLTLATFGQYNCAMCRLTVFVVTLLSITALAFGQSGTKRYLYLSMPDGAQKEGRSDPPGILIFDIDNGHKFVRPD